MIGPVTYLARKAILHFRRSKVPTQITSLSRLHRAVIYLDTVDGDYVSVEKMAKAYFAPYGIDVLIMAPKAWEINFLGWMKESKLHLTTGEDLFICLDGSGSFASEYASACSRAVFKIGRTQFKDNVFDMVLTDPEGVLPRQPKVFTAITEWLDKIV